MLSHLVKPGDFVHLVSDVEDVLVGKKKLLRVCKVLDIIYREDDSKNAVVIRELSVGGFGRPEGMWDVRPGSTNMTVTFDKVFLADEWMEKTLKIFGDVNLRFGKLLQEHTPIPRSR